MADFIDENGVCLVCHPKRLSWKSNIDATEYIWYSTELDDYPDYTSLRTEIWKDKLRIVAEGDDEACYLPKFCPECGRRLNEEG